MRGFIRVWGGPLAEAQQCEIDSHGNFCAGPEVPGQDEIEDQITGGETAGEVDVDGGTVYWEYR
jgi:hypothetical protein